LPKYLFAEISNCQFSSFPCCFSLIAEWPENILIFEDYRFLFRFIFHFRDITISWNVVYNTGPSFISMSASISASVSPDLFTSGLFLRLKTGLPVGLAGAAGPVRPQAWLTHLATPF
jgi:hypothetical protein